MRRKIFDMPEFDAPGWAAHQGDALHIQANYLNVAENLVDPAHVSFVHPTTLGSNASEDVPVKADVSGEVITAWRWIKKRPASWFFPRICRAGGWWIAGIIIICICPLSR